MKRTVVVTALRTFLMLSLVCLGLPALAGASIVDLRLVPSRTELALGDNLNVGLWMYRGSDYNSASHGIQAADYLIQWNSSILAHGAGDGPTPLLSGLWSELTKWNAANEAFVSIGWWGDQAYDLGTGGLHVADLQFSAGCVGQTDLRFTTDPPYSGIFVGNIFPYTKLDPDHQIGFGSTRIKVNGTSPVPLPGGLLLLGSGLGGLFFRKGLTA
ncbi:MAG: hypothetical protein V2A77_05645 [Pseudomonadota bacterium]